MHELEMEDMQLIEDEPRVLIADKVSIIQEAIKRAFDANKNFHIESCVAASDIFKKIRDFQPTVILLGKLSGDDIELSTLKSLQKNITTSNIPVVVMATTESAEYKSSCFSYGASDFIIKLPDSAELSARIKHHSDSYVKTLQLDEAYRAIRVSQQQLLDTNLTLQRVMNDLKKSNEDLEKTNEKLKDSNERLKALANVDGLTGIANRASFDRFIKRYWDIMDNSKSEISLLMIDVDHFKKFNDAFGHVEGDSVLIQVAKVLNSASVENASLAARYGGEEFCIVLPNIGSDQALGIANNLLTAMQAVGIPHNHPSSSSVVTLSVGVATSMPRLLKTPKELIQKADAALYLAKQAGRNQAYIAI
jgi:two-component system chemotaxis family response regulator WspR